MSIQTCRFRKLTHLVLKLKDSTGTTSNLMVEWLVFRWVRNLVSSSRTPQEEQIVDKPAKKMRKQTSALFPGGQHKQLQDPHEEAGKVGELQLPMATPSS